MAITYTDNGGGAPNGSDLEFTYTFPVIQTEDVKVALNGVTQATTKYAVDTASNPTKITFNNTSVDSSVQESTGAPKSGVRVRVYRQTTVGKSTGDDDPKAVYAAGSSIRAVDLNANTEQALYAIHELQEQPIETPELQDDSVTSSKILDGTIVNADVNASAAIDGTKISPDFGSQNIATTGTVDGRDVSVDGTKLDTVETNAKDDQTAAEIRTLVESATDSNVFTDADHTKLNAIEAGATGDQTNAEIRAAVEAATDSNVFTDADHTKLNAIESGATADQTAADIRGLGFFDTSNDGSGSGLDADTVDGIHGASFLRSDESDSFSGLLTLNRSVDEKLILSNSSNPYIRFQEGTTNKAYIEWNSAGYLRLHNQEDSSTLLLRDDISFSSDGSNFNTMWHAGNDGAGSGLDADKLDGVHGASFLRSDASDSFTSGTLTIHGMGLESSGAGQNLKFKRTTSGSDMGLTFYNGSNTWVMQLYATSGAYGFLDGNWNSWDIKKVPSGQFSVDEGSGLQRVLNAGNVGQGGALSATDVWTAKLRPNDWIYFESVTAGLYWSGGPNAGCHFYPENTYRFSLRSGHSSVSMLKLAKSDNALLGGVYGHSSTGIGFVNTSESWVAHTYGSSTQFWFRGDVFPWNNGSQDLGATGNKWDQVHANTFHGDGSNLTGIDAAPSISGTASGSIASEKGCIVNSDATISQAAVLADAMGSVASGQGTPNNSHDIVYTDVCWNKESENGIAVWWQKGSTQRFYAQAFSVSGNTITWGSAVTVQSEETRWPWIEAIGANKFMLVYSKGGYTSVSGNVLTTSGTGNRTISVGTTGNIETGTSGGQFIHMARKTGTNQLMLCYRGNNNGYNRHCMITVNTSNNTFTNSTLQRHSWTQSLHYSRVTYVKNHDKWLLVYGGHTPNYNGYIQVLTVNSSNVINFSNQHQYASNSRKGFLQWYDDGDFGIFVHVSTSNSGHPMASTIQLVQESITRGSEQEVYGSGAWSGGDLAVDQGSGKFVYVHREDNNTRGMWNWITGTKSTANPTVHETTNYSTGVTQYSDGDDVGYEGGVVSVAVANLGNDKFVLLYGDEETSGGKQIKARIKQFASTTVNSGNFVGFSSTSYSNGNTATVKVVGNQSTQSGLTPGSQYYVQDDGSIGTSAGTNNVPAGTAISSTKLLIK